jgi:hypothetical protein
MSMLHRYGIWTLIVAASAAPAYAQSHSNEGLSKLVPNLILTGITLPGAGDPGTPHAGHFTLGNPTFGGSQGASRPDTGTIAAVEAFNDRLRSQFANFPLGSSSGGFTFVFDEKLNTYRRRSESFGPAFAERAATLGRYRSNVGFNFQHVDFDTFGGENLKDRSITFYLPHTDCCSPAAPPPSSLVPGFEGDLIEAALSLKATADTFAVFANYGVTDRFDIGVAIPFSWVDLQADVKATIIRLSTTASPGVHTFVTGQNVTQQGFADAGSASGVGDIVLRSKYNFYNNGDTGISAAVDLRLPTGDSDNLLGLGTTQAKMFLIVSSGGGKVLPHANVGFTVSGKGDQTTEFVFEPLGVSDEFNYAGGVEIVAHRRLTVVADVLGRTLFDGGNVEAEEKSFQFREGAGAAATVPVLTSSTNPLTSQPYRQLTLTPGNLNLALGAVGFKFNAGGTVLVNANVLFPLTKGGLRDLAAFTLGLDFAF